MIKKKRYHFLVRISTLFTSFDVENNWRKDVYILKTTNAQWEDFFQENTNYPFKTINHEWI